MSSIPVMNYGSVSKFRVLLLDEPTRKVDSFFQSVATVVVLYIAVLLNTLMNRFKMNVKTILKAL
jgi:hypothetical protein